MGGTYTLVVQFDTAQHLTIGAAGEYAFPTGWYAYTGSAFGPGGLARIDRHRTVATGENQTRHWHVDYILGCPAVELVDDVRSPGVDAECAIVDAIVEGGPDRVDGIGASDCACAGHLVGPCDREPLRDAIERAHERARADPDGRSSG
jgi:endonuclease-3